jgi:hypothetical protein
VVFAVPIRLKIVTELYQRDMSPKQFYEEFGGGSVSRIAQHFEKLKKTGWLRHIHSEGPGGGRRGATETIYRATELAFCDRPTWAALPYSIRITFSWNAFKEIAERLREAMEASTFQARPDRHFSSTRLLLDEAGWIRVAEAVAEEFATQYEEQEDARRRAARTGEELFDVGSLLLAFELPISAGLRLGPLLIERPEPLIPFRVRLAKVFADEVCMQIIEEANHGPISAPMFYEKYGKRFNLDKATIRRRFKKMVAVGWLKIVGGKSGGSRRGATEKFYRATGPALFDEDKHGPWANLPESLTKTQEWRTFAQLSEWVKGAMEAGTFNQRDDICLAWSILHLDQRGWENLVASLKDLLAFIQREQRAAEIRMRMSGENPIAAVAALGAFETPKPIKEP